MLLVAVLLLVSSVAAQYYEVPDAVVQPLKPKGLRISIPDEPGVELFAIHVNINKPMGNREAGQINTETRKSKNGRWMIEDFRVRLKLGDKLNYWLYVQADGLGYPKDDLTYTVTEFYDPDAPIVDGGEDNRFQTCTPTDTMVNGKTACGGSLVFEDNFDSFNSSNWERVVQFAGAPYYEFVVYGSEKKNSYVSNGKLCIKPTLLSDDGLDPTVDFLTLTGCTSGESSECSKTAQGWSILPPVRTAQLRTKQAFNFRYGRIEVQAKFPTGDWLLPEIWLEPKDNRYGGKPFESGRVQIALVRGNRNLVLNNKDLGARYYEGSCKLAFGDTISPMTVSSDNSGFYSDALHTYSVTWSPDSISFAIDGQEIGKLTPPSGGFSKVAPFSGLQNVPWEQGSKIAPFDQEFYITIGLGVGGFGEFPDGCKSNNRPKPWKNFNYKGMMTFWRDRDNWFPSWSGDGSIMQVEHVKVWAL